MNYSIAFEICTHLHLSLVDLPPASSTVETATEALAVHRQFLSAAGSISTAFCPIVSAASATEDGPASRTVCDKPKLS